MCSGKYLCNLADIFVHGYISVIWNVCKPLLLATYWLQWVHMRYMYRPSCPICMQEVIGICGIDMAFEEHISYWHIYGYSMVNEKWSILLFWLVYAVMWGLHIEYIIRSGGHTFMIWQAHLFRGICQLCVMYSNTPGYTVDCSEFVRYIYWHSFLIFAHELISICGIWGVY